MENYYKTLNLKDFASIDDVKTAYKTLAKKYHPDSNVSKSETEKEECLTKMKDINIAYDNIGDVSKKSDYDNKLKNNGKNNFGNFEQSYGDKSYGDKSWGNNPFKESRYMSLNVQEYVTFSFDKLANFSYTHSYIYHNADTYKKIPESIHVKFDISDLPPDLQIVNDVHGNMFLKIIMAYSNKGNILNNLRGNYLLILMFKIPDNIKIDENYNIIHDYDVTLYDILFEESLEVETIFKQKFKIKIKKLNSISKIKCVLNSKGLTFLNRINMLQTKKQTSNYIFNMNIKEIYIDNLEWKDKSKFKKMVELISKKPDK